jgi:large subunit ribosomal protein L31e
MAIKTEAEYVIPLRKSWLKVPRYRRAPRAIKEIKLFIAKHMKLPDRDVNKVKVDKYLNSEVWFKGIKSPPSKLKVKAKKSGDNILVTFVETPQYVKFMKEKHERRHKKAEPKSAPAPIKEIRPKEEKTEEQKKEEKEKSISVEESKAKEAKQDAKAQKHLTSVKEPKINRLALKK